MAAYRSLAAIGSLAGVYARSSPSARMESSLLLEQLGFQGIASRVFLAETSRLFFSRTAARGFSSSTLEPVPGSSDVVTSILWKLPSQNVDEEPRNRLGVSLITMNQPKTLNALSSELMRNVVAAAQGAEANPEVGAIILTGGSRAFAAGADIKEMASKGVADAYACSLFGAWDALVRVRKPIIAAVDGYALGGGCELAMMCDVIVAGHKAKFGQPELALGVIPGMGGTQRLTRLIGRSRAMDMILTGRQLSADEAERCGLVSRVFPSEQLLEGALKMAFTIASYSAPAVALAKEAVRAAAEVPESAGVALERKLFYSCFALEDQKEGMAAFIEKRKPEFKDR